jgi:hypothetical protein
MDSVLEHPRTIAEREEMAHPHLRKGGCLPESNNRIKRNHIFRSDTLACSLKDQEIALGRLGPGHRPARRVCPLAHSVTADIVGQQAGNLGAHGCSIPEGNQNAASVTQQFLGMPVRRRYHGLSQTEAVGQCARCHLSFVEIGRHIDVTHRNEVQQCGLIHELVEKDNMILDAEFPYARSQTVAIGFAFILYEIRMGRAEYHINGVRADLDDSRHGVDHRLNALAGRQQTERQNDLLANEA